MGLLVTQEYLISIAKYQEIMHMNTIVEVSQCLENPTMLLRCLPVVAQRKSLLSTFLISANHSFSVCRNVTLTPLIERIL